MTHILSFVILDDLFPCYGPKHQTVQDLKNLKFTINDFIKDFENGQKTDKSGYFDSKFFEKKNKYLETIVENLTKFNYHVLNRYNKYYVIAFSMNYTRFEVFSKDFDKELIKWRENDKDDQITGTINNTDYNKNPVLNLIESFNKELK